MTFDADSSELKLAKIYGQEIVNIHYLWARDGFKPQRLVTCQLTVLINLANTHIYLTFVSVIRPVVLVQNVWFRLMHLFVVVVDAVDAVVEFSLVF
jgi:hypothetical protein